MIKNIVFDLGGVIVTLAPQRPLDRFKEIGVTDIEEWLNPYEQKGIFLEFENGKADMNTFRRKLSEQIGKEVSEEDVYYCWMGFMYDVPQEKLDFLTELRKKYKVYVLTNNNPAIMRWARSPLFSPSGQPLTDFIDKLYVSYEIGITKPNPEIFEYMLKDARICASETLFVDDGTRNIQTATELGFHTYQPENEEDWREEIKRLLE